MNESLGRNETNGAVEKVQRKLDGSSTVYNTVSVKLMDVWGGGKSPSI